MEIGTILIITIIVILAVLVNIYDSKNQQAIA